MHGIYLLQKLLLLPELSGNLVKTTIRISSPNVMLTHQMVSKELDNNNNGDELLSDKPTSARILVSGLSASWRHVNSYNSIDF